MNVSDSEIVASVLQSNRYVVVDDVDAADAVLVNTCAIRDGAEAKIWHRLRQLKREWKDAKSRAIRSALRRGEKPPAGGAFYVTLVPVRPRRRGERRSLRTFPVVSLRPPLAFNPRPRRLSTPTDAFQLHPDIIARIERPSSSDASAAQKRIAKRVGDRDASLTWSSLIPWLKSIVPALPIILKGVMTREDAALAVAHGVDGVWVSNHGGRQLDGAPSTLRALAEVVAGVNDVRNGNATSVTQTVTENVVPVVFDGGVRRGSDVLKALALGADVVAIGRPVAWGLACGGEAGVRKAIDVLTEELESSMRLAGVTSARDAREKGIARAAWTSPRAPTSKL